MRAQTRRSRQNRGPRRPQVEKQSFRATAPAAATEPRPRESLLLDMQRWANTPRARLVARYVGYGLAIVLVAALAGYGFASLGDKVWAARSEVLYQLDAERPTGFLREDRQLTTQLVALRSHEVLEPVAEANDLTVDELSEKLHVSVVGDSEVLRIEVHDKSADEAETLAADIANTYILSTPNGSTAATEHLRDELAALDERLQPLLTRVTELEQRRLGNAGSGGLTPPVTAEETVLQAEIQSLLDDRSELRSRLEEVAVAEFQGPQVELITDAYALDTPVSPRPWLAAAAGALVGLLVAAITVAVLVWRNLAVSVAVVIAGLVTAATFWPPFQRVANQATQDPGGSDDQDLGVDRWGASGKYSGRLIRSATETDGKSRDSVGSSRGRGAGGFIALVRGLDRGIGRTRPESAGTLSASERSPGQDGAPSGQGTPVSTPPTPLVTPPITLPTVPPTAPPPTHATTPPTPSPTVPPITPPTKPPKTVPIAPPDLDPPLGIDLPGPISLGSEASRPPATPSGQEEASPAPLPVTPPAPLPAPVPAATPPAPLPAPVPAASPVPLPATPPPTQPAPLPATPTPTTPAVPPATPPAPRPATPRPTPPVPPATPPAPLPATPTPTTPTVPPIPGEEAPDPDPSLPTDLPDVIPAPPPAPNVGL